MFATPRYVLKGGSLIVEEGELRHAPSGRRLRVAPGFDDAIVPDVRRHFEAFSSISFANYPVRDLPGEPVPIG
jgi:formylmethanofuran dehydrogenase subunit A